MFHATLKATPNKNNQFHDNLIIGSYSQGCLVRELQTLANYYGDPVSYWSVESEKLGISSDKSMSYIPKDTKPLVVIQPSN